MAYPSTLDTTSTIPTESANTPLSTNHVTSHSAIQTAIIAIETLLGVTASAVTGTFNYILGEITGSDKAVGKTATQTLTNKTLTSAKVPLGSDAVGDMRFTSNADGTQTRIPVGSDNYILKLNGTTPGWEAETVTVAATESVEGIGRLATSAQINAGTASEASYPLFVTPDQLAASTPVFNGGSITNITRLLNTVTTDVTYSSSTAENTLLSYSVPANTLSTSNVIRVTMHVAGLGVTGTNTWTLRLKYGATTIVTKVFTNVNTNNTFVGKMEFLLAGAGTTSSQNGSYALNLGFANYVGSSGLQATMVTESAQGTSSEDSTASKTLAVTSQHSYSSANDNITVSIITTEVLR